MAKQRLSVGMSDNMKQVVESNSFQQGMSQSEYASYLMEKGLNSNENTSLINNVENMQNNITNNITVTNHNYFEQKQNCDFVESNNYKID